jgi:hypothetical protein
LKSNHWRYATDEATISPNGLGIKCTKGPTSEEKKLQIVYAAKEFPVSAASLKDNFVGILIYYFEVTQTNAGIG